jgi:hypothetical protein
LILSPSAENAGMRCSQVHSQRAKQTCTRSSRINFLCRSAAEPPSSSQGFILPAQGLKLMKAYRKLVDSGMTPDAAQVVVETSSELAIAVATEPLPGILSYLNELKDELKAELEELKGELKGEVKEVKGEVKEVKGEVKKVGGELKAFIFFAVVVALSNEEFRKVARDVLSGALFSLGLGG